VEPSVCGSDPRFALARLRAQTASLVLPVTVVNHFAFHWLSEETVTLSSSNPAFGTRKQKSHSVSSPLLFIWNKRSTFRAHLFAKLAQQRSVRRTNLKRARTAFVQRKPFLLDQSAVLLMRVHRKKLCTSKNNCLLQTEILHEEHCRNTTLRALVGERTRELRSEREC